jgi:hypothetical protein
MLRQSPFAAKVVSHPNQRLPANIYHVSVPWPVPWPVRLSAKVVHLFTDSSFRAYPVADLKLDCLVSHQRAPCRSPGTHTRRMDFRRILTGRMRGVPSGGHRGNLGQSSKAQSRLDKNVGNMQVMLARVHCHHVPIFVRTPLLA